MAMIVHVIYTIHPVYAHCILYMYMYMYTTYELTYSRAHQCALYVYMYMYMVMTYGVAYFLRSLKVFQL